MENKYREIALSFAAASLGEALRDIQKRTAKETTETARRKKL